METARASEIGQPAETSKGRRQSQLTLATIVSHPIRARCWVILAERPASPTELSHLLEEPLAKVAYHVRELKVAGVIELVKTEPRRGSTEHWYRSTERPLLDDEGTAARSIEERDDYARFILQRHFADATLSLEEGVMCRRHDHWLARFPLQLDEEGWRELHDAYDELTNRILDAQAASAERVASAGGETETIPISAFASYFEMPPPGTIPDR